MTFDTGVAPNAIFPDAVLKRPGQGLGLNMGVVKRKNSETMDEAIARISLLPGVKSVQAEVIYTHTQTIQPDALTSNDPRIGDQWALNTIKAKDAWSLGVGRSDTHAGAVCVIDTGLNYNHQDLKANLFPTTFNANPTFYKGRNVMDNATDINDSMDDLGHGEWSC